MSLSLSMIMVVSWASVAALGAVVWWRRKSAAIHTLIIDSVVLVAVSWLAEPADLPVCRSIRVQPKKLVPGAVIVDGSAGSTRLGGGGAACGARFAAPESVAVGAPPDAAPVGAGPAAASPCT